MTAVLDVKTLVSAFIGAALAWVGHGGVATLLDAASTPRPPASDALGHVPGSESPTCGGQCGVERWAVKTLSDPDRERVQRRPVDTTIEALVALQRPAVLSAVARADPSHRAGPKGDRR